MTWAEEIEAFIKIHNGKTFLLATDPSASSAIHIILSGGVPGIDLGVAGNMLEPGGDPAQDWSKDSERGGV
jgi:hypothetical protein